MSNVHIVYEGQSHDLGLDQLIQNQDRHALGIDEDIDINSQDLTADQIRRALSIHFDRSLDEFNELSVDFHKDGNITVRPNATFGNFLT